MRKIFIFTFIFTSLNLALAQPDYKSWDTFLKKYVSITGDVDYKSIKTNKKELDAITKVFSTVKVAQSWSKSDQLAFWINAYNAYTIDLLVQNYPLKSIQNLDGGKPWDVKRITIGGKKYSLNNIENDIIRPQFKDARIHFALNCGAKSCPPLLNAAYVGKTLDEQLDSQTKIFINNKMFQNLTVSTMTISKIFDWYSVDFGNIVNFINKYRVNKVHPNAKISYMEYNWALNGK
ncbi:MAG: DUF547 domain-containing protein [Saprospiraceae bacterium]|jgi:hypothetical protein|nr:DUF547 domain-containing protein [Saprospiraceae bacterium]